MIDLCDCIRHEYITVSCPALTSRLKIANRSYDHSALVLWNHLPSHLLQVVHHVTASPILNSPAVCV